MSDAPVTVATAGDAALLASGGGIFDPAIFDGLIFDVSLNSGSVLVVVDAAVVTVSVSDALVTD